MKTRPLGRKLIREFDTDRGPGSVSNSLINSSTPAVSERVLRRRFAAAPGQPRRDYLQQARLLRAMALLGTSTTSVSEIAAVVGFGSASAPARAFRAWAGESPSAYRGSTQG